MYILSNHAPHGNQLRVVIQKLHKITITVALH